MHLQLWALLLLLTWSGCPEIIITIIHYLFFCYWYKLWIDNFTTIYIILFSHYIFITLLLFIVIAIMQITCIASIFIISENCKETISKKKTNHKLPLLTKKTIYIYAEAKNAQSKCQCQPFINFASTIQQPVDRLHAVSKRELI